MGGIHGGAHLRGARLSAKGAAVPAAPKRPLWFLDTASLLSLAVDDSLRGVVVQELRTQRRVLLDVVHDELRELAAGDAAVAGLAASALAQLEWLGDVVDTDQLADPQLVVAVQDVIRGGRPLKHPREHWAESVIIAVGARVTDAVPHVLTEDYNARLEAQQRNLVPFSIHKLLSKMVRERRLDDTTAVAFTDALKAAGRGPDCTADELHSGRLGRVGRP